jgi:hypothetical protein
MKSEITNILIPVISALLGTILGGIFSIIGVCYNIKQQRKVEKERFLFEKEYDICKLLIEFLFALIGFIGDKMSPLQEVESISHTVELEEEWDTVVQLKNEIYPLIYLIFDNEIVEKIENIYNDISMGAHDIKFASTAEALKSFVVEIRTRYLKY